MNTKRTRKLQADGQEGKGRGRVTMKRKRKRTMGEEERDERRDRWRKKTKRKRNVNWRRSKSLRKGYRNPKGKRARNMGKVMKPKSKRKPFRKLKR